LVADFPLAVLELDLELGELRLARVEVRGAVRELLLEAHAAVVGGRLLVEPAAERRLAPLRCLELGPQLGEVGTVGDGLGISGRPRGQLETKLDVRRPWLLRAFFFVTAAALFELGAEAGPESLLGLCALILGFVRHGWPPVRRSWRG